MTVDQTNIVDFVTISPESGDCSLTISDHLDWENDHDEHIWKLQEKINSYLRFVEGGELYEKYPNAKGKRIEIRVIGKFRLNLVASEFYARAGKVLHDAGFELVFEKFNYN